MHRKLFDSDFKIMQILWDKGPLPAKEIADETSETFGWTKATTYTLIRRCIEKGLIERSEPHFLCTPLITKKDACQSETKQLLGKFFDGIPDQLIASLLQTEKKLPPEKVAYLLDLINKNTQK